MNRSDNVIQTVGKILAVVLVACILGSLVVVGLVTAGIVEVEDPEITSVTTEWGDATEETTALQTTVTVDNPNAVGVPSILTVEYAALMNDVSIAEGERNRVGLSSGTTTIEVTGEMDNDRIADWWVEHINRGEYSELEITAEVKGPGGISEHVPVRQSSFETDLLGHLSSDEPTNLTFRGDPFVRVTDQDASWGTATSEETPITFSATVENHHDHPLTFDGFGYEITMNDVVVGTGQIENSVEIAPGESEAVRVDAAIETQRMASWWASHVQHNETTELSVNVYGYVNQGGERKHVPLSVLGEDVSFTTDFLEGGEVEVEPIESDRTSDIDQPKVVGFDLEWEDVNDDVTRIRSIADLQNPNDEAFSDLFFLEVEQTKEINDVLVAEDRTFVDSIQPGDNEITHVGSMDNAKVPEWWAAHINRGEASTLVTSANVTADVGFTQFDLQGHEHNATMETNMLSSMTRSESQSIRVDGKTVATVHNVEAEWGHALTDRVPIVIEATIENQGHELLILRYVDLHMDLNDVVVADSRSARSHSISPGRTETVHFTVYKNLTVMDEWWVTHIRADETTVSSYEAVLTVESGTQFEQIILVDGEDTIETNLLSVSDSQERIRY